MSKEIGAELIGLSDLKQKLEALGSELPKEMIETALKAGALPIVAEAKLHAPVKTGTLRRSIHEGEPEWESDTVASIKIGVSLAEVPYAARQEFGFVGTEEVKEHTRTSKTGVVHTVHTFTREASTPAHPYLRPGFDNKREEAVKEMADVMKVLIRKRAGGK